MPKFIIRTHIITNYEVEAETADDAAEIFNDMSTHVNLHDHTTDAWIDKVVPAEAAVWPYWGEDVDDARTPEPELTKESTR